MQTKTRQRIFGVVMAVFGLICIGIAAYLVQTSFSSNEVWKIALMIFGIVELMITGVFSLRISWEFLKEETN